MENETQTTSPVRQVLIVAAPNDQEASELAKAFVWPPISRRPGRTSCSRTPLLVVLGLLVAVGLLIYGCAGFPPSTSTPTPLSATATALLSHPYPYVATHPGPGCDSGGADWSIGSQFKAPVTPVAGTATVSPQATPTLQVIVDPSTRTACQQNGLLVTHTDHFDSYATIIFGEHGLPLAHHFRTQITATVVTATSSAGFDLEVRRQDGAFSTSGTNSGYGNDALDVGVDGSWQADRLNDTTDQVDATFTRGFVQPAKSFTLAAEVDGPLMTFSINGHKVTTAFDPTYPESYGIDFGIADPDAKSPPSALFSHFVYTALPDTHLSLSDARATATAQVATASQTPYVAAVPGFGCDTGGGQWKPASVASDYVTTRCLPQGLQVSEGASENYIGSVSFYWLNGNFPANYKVKARIDVSGLAGGCAGMMTRTDGQSLGGYSFSICADGSWQIERYDDNSNAHQLAQGQVAQRSAYTVEATSNGPTQTLDLDGAQVGSVSDKTYTTTDHLELFVSPPQGSAGSAVFSNFVFTPLSSPFGQLGTPF